MELARRHLRLRRLRACPGRRCGQQIDYVMIRSDQPFDSVLTAFLAARKEKSDVKRPKFCHSERREESSPQLTQGTSRSAFPRNADVDAPNFIPSRVRLRQPRHAWLARAAAAPLLIHLWSRQQYREAPWAAMQFLLAAMRKNSRRLQLQQWLLIAIRTLIIILVVLAVAEPYGDQLLAGKYAAPSPQDPGESIARIQWHHADANSNLAPSRRPPKS